MFNAKQIISSLFFYGLKATVQDPFCNLTCPLKIHRSNHITFQRWMKSNLAVRPGKVIVFHQEKTCFTEGETVCQNTIIWHAGLDEGTSSMLVLFASITQRKYTSIRMKDIYSRISMQITHIWTTVKHERKTRANNTLLQLQFPLILYKASIRDTKVRYVSLCYIKT